MAKSKTYPIKTYCKNCDNTDEFNIVIGTPVIQILPSVLCLVCGCRAIRQSKEHRY